MNSFDALFSQIKELILSARNTISRNVNTIQVITNFEIGHRIVEHEQHGAERAEYGKQVLKELAGKLETDFGKGFSITNLKSMRQFYLVYKKRIGQTLSGELPDIEKGQTLSDQLATQRTTDLSKALSSKFLLSWSHYVFLMGINNQEERSFYEIEAAQQNWSVREIKRQFNSGLFERLALSRDKEGVRKLAYEGHFFVDLVFYNRLLCCYVLIDLKTGKLTHQDLGQMQMYVNYFDRYVKLESETPTVGIILCRKKHDALVEITLPKGANIRASEYQLYLPNKEELRQKLVEWIEEAELSDEGAKYGE